MYAYWDFYTVLHLTKCEEFTQKQDVSTMHQIFITVWKHAYRIESWSDMMRLLIWWKCNILILAYFHVEKYKVHLSKSCFSENIKWLFSAWSLVQELPTENYRKPCSTLRWQTYLSTYNEAVWYERSRWFERISFKRKGRSFLPVLMEHPHLPTPVVTVSLSFLNSPQLLDCAMSLWMSISSQ